MEHEIKQITALIDDYAARVRELNEAGQEINKILENLKDRISTQGTVKKADLAAGSKIDIYQDEYFGPQAKEMFEKIENALGFKLFFWQKAYIITGNFRHYGATMAEILKLLTDTEKEPIDYSRPAKSNTEKVFRDELKEIQYRLAASGIKTRAVFWNQEQKRKFYDQARKENRRDLTQ